MQTCRREEQKEETVKAVMDALAVKGIYISDIEARMRIARQMKENGEKYRHSSRERGEKDGRREKTIAFGIFEKIPKAGKVFDVQRL